MVTDAGFPFHAVPSSIRGCQSGTWSAGQKNTNFCPRSRLSFWSREEGLALPPRIGSPILHARAESGAYSRAPLLRPAFRDDAAAVCSPLPLARTIWRVGLAEDAPSTPSNNTSCVPLTLAVPRGPLPSLHFLRIWSCPCREAAGEGRILSHD